MKLLITCHNEVTSESVDKIDLHMEYCPYKWMLNFMCNYPLLNHFNMFDICLRLSNASQHVGGLIKRKGTFHAAVPEEQIILAKLSHHDKIEPGTRLLYFGNARVRVPSWKNNKIFDIKTGWVKYENLSTSTVIKVIYFVCGRRVKSGKMNFWQLLWQKQDILHAANWIKKEHVPTPNVATQMLWNCEWSSLTVKASHKII